MPIQTIDDWNNATFQQAFNECFSRSDQGFRDRLWDYIYNVLPGHKALACKVQDKTLLHFLPFVFTSRNCEFDAAYVGYIGGIQAFNAFAKSIIGNYSQQYSHSERAIGVCLYRNNRNHPDTNTNPLLIKNRLPACGNCQEFLTGRAMYTNLLNNNIFVIYFIGKNKENILRERGHPVLSSIYLLGQGFTTQVSYQENDKAPVEDGGNYTCTGL